MEIEYSQGGPIGWLQKRWFEFRQGHGVYLGFFLSFINFVLISYNLFLEKVFTELTLFQFCVVFGSLYIPGGIILGRLHIKKQTKYDTGMIFNQDPGHQKMMREVMEIKELLQNHLQVLEEDDKVHE